MAAWSGRARMTIGIGELVRGVGTGAWSMPISKPHAIARRSITSIVSHSSKSTSTATGSWLSALRPTVVQPCAVIRTCPRFHSASFSSQAHSPGPHRFTSAHNHVKASNRLSARVAIAFGIACGMGVGYFATATGAISLGPQGSFGILGQVIAPATMSCEASPGASSDEPLSSADGNGAASSAQKPKKSSRLSQRGKPSPETFRQITVGSISGMLLVSLL